MATDSRIKELAAILRGVIEGLHDSAPECLQCPLRGTEACVACSDSLGRLDAIIEG